LEQVSRPHQYRGHPGCLADRKCGLPGVSGLIGSQVSHSGPNPFERSFKCFLLINLRRVEDKRFQLLEPEGRVLKSPGASLRFIKNPLGKAKRFGHFANPKTRSISPTCSIASLISQQTPEREYTLTFRRCDDIRGRFVRGNRGMRRIHPMEGLTLLFLTAILLLIILFYPQFPNGPVLLAQSVALILMVLIVSGVRSRWGVHKAVRSLCTFFYLAFIIAVFQWIGDVIPHLGHNVDRLLIKIDFALFAVHPTIWLERLVAPWLTDILCLAYVTYFFIPVILIVILIVQGHEQQCMVAVFTLLLGFYSVFLAYIVMPAVGPRFTLAHLQSTQLPGGAIAESILSLLNRLEYNKWDCFPSGHTQIVLISLWFAYKHNRTLFWIFLPMVAALILSTVYLRYHYVIDVVAGFFFAAGALLAGPKLWRWWIKGSTGRCGRSYISYPLGPLSPSA